MNSFPSSFDSWSDEHRERFYKFIEAKMKVEAESEVRKAEAAAEAEARKAEAEAEARKAEAESEARKAEAEARKAEAESAARKVEAESAARKAQVSSRMIRIKATHWDALNSHIFDVPRDITLDIFRSYIRGYFNDEITTRDFRLYLLPPSCEDIEERVLVETHAHLEDYLQSTEIASDRLRSLYVWNYESSSPGKLPEQQAPKVGSASSSSSPRRSKQYVDACSVAYKCCLCCGADKSLEACHIYDFSEQKKVKPELREATLDTLDLVHIHELYNLVRLCKDCHYKFDYFDIAIDPSEKCWVWNGNTKRNISMSAFHGKKVDFHKNGIPSKALLSWKMRRFVAKNQARFCCFCTENFPIATSTAEDFIDHKLACKLKCATLSEKTENLKEAEGMAGKK